MTTYPVVRTWMNLSAILKLVLLRDLRSKISLLIMRNMVRSFFLTFAVILSSYFDSGLSQPITNSSKKLYWYRSLHESKNFYLSYKIVTTLRLSLIYRFQMPHKEEVSDFLIFWSTHFFKSWKGKTRLKGFSPKRG